jgi:hypothetical protein
MRDYDPAVGRYVESDPTGLAGGSYSTYAYVSDDPVAQSDPFGVMGMGSGAGRVAPRAQLSPAAQALVCAAIKECAGDADCVFKTLNQERKSAWSDPALRQAENFATAAAPNSYQGSDFDKSFMHSPTGVAFYQYVVKPFVYPVLNLPTTPVSDDAYSAGIAGLFLYGKSAAEIMQSCNQCSAAQ